MNTNELYKEAKEQTLATLPEFLERVSSAARDDWDYNTGVDAIAISAVAASWAMEHEPGLGASGSSAGMTTWAYMIHYGGISLPAKIVEYENMLYPQYAYLYEKTIDRHTWSALREMAISRLQYKHLSQEVRDHMQSIADGTPPFGYTIQGDGE